MLITQAEFARRHGFSRQYVHKLARQGKIKLVNGMVDENTDCAAGHGKWENLSELLVRVRLKNEIERGKILEAKAKAEISKLASAEKVRKTAAANAKIVRDRVLDVVDRVSATLATINDTSQIRQILTKELGNAMETLGDLSDEKQD